MKKHTDLKELLGDYSMALLDMAENKSSINSEKLADDFCSSNSLALGKQEPLTKNKQTQKLCDVCGADITGEDEDVILCGDCYLDYEAKLADATSR